MDNFSDLISAWGRQEMAADLGVDVARVHKWAQRNRIPATFDFDLERIGQARGIEIDCRELAKMRRVSQ
jgi:DNA-binding transcriptional regulator YiaG